MLSIDRAKHAAVGAEIRRQIESWAQLQPEITEWPFMPEGIQDRDADVWEPLLAVADLVGGAETPTNLRVKSRPKIIGVAFHKIRRPLHYWTTETPE